MAKRLVFITGDYLSDATAQFVRETGIPYLKKPFTRKDILEVTNMVLAKRADAPGGTPLQGN